MTLKCAEYTIWWGLVALNCPSVIQYFHSDRAETHELFGLRHLASEAVYLNGENLHASVIRFISHCDDLRSYLDNNEIALIDYGSRYRADKPVPTSRAEGCVAHGGMRLNADCSRLVSRIAVVSAVARPARAWRRAHRRQGRCAPPSAKAPAEGAGAILDRGCARHLGELRPGRRNGHRSAEQRDIG